MSDIISKSPGLRPSFPVQPVKPVTEDASEERRKEKTPQDRSSPSADEPVSDDVERRSTIDEYI